MKPNAAMRSLLCSLLIAVAFLGSGLFADAQLVLQWAAYNDYVPSAGTHPNANVYNLRGVAGLPAEPTEGLLRDFFSGDPTSVYLIATATGAPDYFGTIAYPEPGTPAYELFNGIVDVGNRNSAIGIRANEGTTTTVTFTNLNPSRRYNFRGTSVRGGAYGRRWTLATLSGAESFIDAHTAGVFTMDNFPSGTMTSGQAAYNSGENRGEGALVAWDEIDPGADGILSITCQQYADDPLPNGESPDLTFYGYAFCAIYLAEMGPAMPVVITSNPPPTLIIGENRTLRLSAAAQGAPPPAYQWFKDDVEISGATSRSFQIDTAQLSDSGAYYVVASNPMNQATSSVCQVTVSSDTNGPILLSAKADESFARIILFWDEPVLGGPAIDTFNYVFTTPSGAESQINSISYHGDRVILNVPLMMPETNYTLEIGYQTDVVGNPTERVGEPQGDPNGIVANVRTFVITPGFTRFSAYLGLGTTGTVAEFTAMPVYPDSATFGYHTNFVNWPISNPNIDQYAMRFTGYFIPTENGLHRFNPGHDDEGRLRIYASEDPNGSFVELTEPYSAGAASFIGGGALEADLVSGQRYFYEFIVRDNAGRDHAGLAVTLPSGAISAPISSQFLAVGADPAGASITITEQPTNTSFAADPGVTLFSQDFNSGDGGFTVTTPVPYDGPWMYNSSAGSWQQNGQAAQTNRSTTSLLDSPALTLDVSGEVILSFEHRYAFERPDWDGGQVRLSVNGGPFALVSPTAFISKGYTGIMRPSSIAAMQPAFIGESSGFVFITNVASLGVFNTGDVIRVEFLAINDPAVAGRQTPNWEINAVRLNQGASLNATFSVAASGTSATATNPPQSYQWFRHDGSQFVPIFGANGATYTFPPRASDNGAQFQVVVCVPGACTTSSIATLTVGGEVSPLRYNRSGADLILSWDAPARLQQTTNLAPPIGWEDIDTGGSTTFVVSAHEAAIRFFRLISPE